LPFRSPQLCAADLIDADASDAEMPPPPPLEGACALSEKILFPEVFVWNRVEKT